MNFGLIMRVLFPSACLACGAEIGEGAICEACFGEIARDRTLFCAVCRARLPDGKKICHKDAPMLLGSAGPYDAKAIKALIHALKFGGITAAAGPLGDLLADYASGLSLDLRSSIVVPLPLSARRERIRGFNQSALIARRFAAQRGLPVEEAILFRTGHRKPQSETKSAAERRENIRGCFTVPRKILTEGKNIILIDDVVTSGATLTEAARTLKAAGAKKILALAAARV